MSNKYVDFVSDKDFLECVNYVCKVYIESSNSENDINKNTIDPIKQIFDICAGNISYEDWVKNEQLRQLDKTINNRIGEFHQKLLGKVSGWVDLGVGDENQVDLKNKKETIFIELKNKYNTMNSSSTAECRRKLERIIRRYPNATAYWAYIIGNGSSGICNWKYGTKNNPKIKKVWGKEVYKLVTGKEESLDQVWKALPLAINDITGNKIKFSSHDYKILQDFFESAFQ